MHQNQKSLTIKNNLTKKSHSKKETYYNKPTIPLRAVCSSTPNEAVRDSKIGDYFRKEKMNKSKKDHSGSITSSITKRKDKNKNKSAPTTLDLFKKYISENNIEAFHSKSVKSSTKVGMEKTVNNQCSDNKTNRITDLLADKKEADEIKEYSLDYLVNYMTEPFKKNKYFNLKGLNSIKEELAQVYSMRPATNISTKKENLVDNQQQTTIIEEAYNIPGLESMFKEPRQDQQIPPDLNNLFDVGKSLNDDYMANIHASQDDFFKITDSKNSYFTLGNYCSEKKTDDFAGVNFFGNDKNFGMPSSLFDLKENQPLFQDVFSTDFTSSLNTKGLRQDLLNGNNLFEPSHFSFF